MKPQGVGIGAIDLDGLYNNPTHPTSFWPRYVRCQDGHTRALYGTGPLPDWAIREFVTIEDFVDYDECPAGTVSYGLTSAGYDIRVGYKFKVFTNAYCQTVSPRGINPKCFIDHDLTPVEHIWNKEEGVTAAHGFNQFQCQKCQEWTHHPEDKKFCKGQDSILIPSNCFALAESVERLYIPRNVDCWCIGKSTYARCGINMNFTPFEPGWYGIVVVEIINATPLPVEIIAGQGIGQAQFFLMAGEPERDYSQKKNAKYQGQTGITLPTVK